MMTKRELCMIIVNDKLGGRTANITDLLKSSTLAVALEYLNFLHLKEMKEYAAQRDGVVFCGIVDVDSCKAKTLSFRDILSLLPKE